MARSDTYLKLYAFLEDYIQAHGRAPVFTEMMAGIDRGRSSVQHNLTVLQTKGYIDRVRYQTRSIRLLKTQGQGVPIWGSIAAGYLSEVFADEAEYLPISSPRLRRGDFALRVAGDSMLDEHIPDGSIVIMRPTEEPDKLKDGTIVAAWVEGRGTTLKCLYRDGYRMTLMPANPNYPPIQINTQEQRMEVQGVLLWVVQERSWG